MAAERVKVLTVKPEFLADILAGKKSWEVRRSNAHYRGTVAFAASGTRRIRGTGQLVEARWLSHNALATPLATQFHRLQEQQINTYGSATGAWVWVFESVELFEYPLAWSPRRGCVIWSNVPEDKADLIDIAPRATQLDREEIFQHMQAALAETLGDSPGEDKIRPTKRGREEDAEAQPTSFAKCSRPPRAAAADK